MEEEQDLQAALRGSPRDKEPGQADYAEQEEASQALEGGGGGGRGAAAAAAAALGTTARKSQANALKYPPESFR